MWPRLTFHAQAISISIPTTNEVKELVFSRTLTNLLRESIDVVWADVKQMALIDSIYRNYHIPPILFSVSPDPDLPGNALRVCLDGKQRLTSIVRFMQGYVVSFCSLHVCWELTALPELTQIARSLVRFLLRSNLTRGHPY